MVRSTSPRPPAPASGRVMRSRIRATCLAPRSDEVTPVEHRGPATLSGGQHQGLDRERRHPDVGVRQRRPVRARPEGEAAVGARLVGGLDLAGIADLAVERNIDPKPRSGRQERIENLINRFL